MDMLISLALCRATYIKKFEDLLGKFSKLLLKMMGRLVNRSSPTGIRLIRNLCCTKIGRRNEADFKAVIGSLYNYDDTYG